MKACPFCQDSTEVDTPKRSVVRRTSTIGQWLIPTAVLALMPKCPMCIAAYLAVAGIGVSMPVAGWMRYGIIVGCVATLTWCAWRAIRRLIRRRHLSV